MEAGVAVLDHAVLVLNPHEHMVRVQDIFTNLTLFVISEAQGVVALIVGLTVDGLEDVLGVVLKHLLGFFGKLGRVVLILLVQLLVSSSTVLGQGRRVDSVTVSCFVNAVHRRTSSNNSLVRTTGLEPHTTRNSVRNFGLGRSQADRAFRVLNELVTLGSHPAGFVIRRNFLIESGHLLNIAVGSGEGTQRSFDQTIERTWHKTIGLAEHYYLVAALVRERLNPNAVLLIGAGYPGVLSTQLVSPGNALIASTKGEGTLATITGNHIWKSVSLRTKDRRVRAILIAELSIYGDAIQLHVAVGVSSTRVTTRTSQVHVTRD